MLRQVSTAAIAIELRRRTDLARVRAFLGGTTIKALALDAGVCRMTMARWLRGRVQPGKYAVACWRHAAAARMAPRPGYRPFTSAERRILRRDYGRVPAPRIAERLGRRVGAIHQAADRLGLSRRRKSFEGIEVLIRERNADGWPDSEIAAAWGCDRHCVARRRKAMGLPNNARSQHVRAKIAARTVEQCRAAGVANLGELRVKIYRDRARAAGWPEDLRFRAVQILDALWDRGPMTRPQIAEAVGMPWKGTRASLHSNDPEGCYMAHLVARGLVVDLGRIVRGKGKGHSTHLYSLPIGIERQPPT